MFFAALAAVLFILVSPTSALDVLILRRALKFLSYGGLLLALVLTLPFIRKETFRGYIEMLSWKKVF